MKTTQTFLNYFLEHQTLVIDGKIGPKSKFAIKLAIDKLKGKCSKEDLIWNKSFMFIGIRTDNDLDNTFDDWFVLIENESKLIAVPSSTVSGVSGIYKYVKIWIRGRVGVGTIKENQQIDYILIKGTHSGWASWSGGLGFLFQDKHISIYRGATIKNGKWVIDKNNLVLRDIGGGFNVHSWRGWLVNYVASLSEGCQVCKANDWAIIFPIITKNAQRNRVTYTLLQF